MLVATSGQTTSYSIVHNTSNGTAGNSTASATSATKKSTTSNSTNVSAPAAAKSLYNNNNHSSSGITVKNSLNSNTHGTTFNNYQNNKCENIVSKKISNANRAVGGSSRDIISTSIITAANHSSKVENSTKAAIATISKHQSFIQTLKDSVQKALILTTGASGNNSISNKFSADKIPNNCNNSNKSVHTVTSSLSSTSHNANKISTATSSNTSCNSTAATQSSPSVSVGRSKYFSCSLSKLHTVAPTVIHRYPGERQHASSADSLQKEMCHFKPIRIVPKAPWKSGSKSRGNCLRFPKANLATKKIEFVLKSNCDANNRNKKKQQQSRTRNDKINEYVNYIHDNEQENDKFLGIYKPKPSLSCLSTSITAPNHQSAFVCLVSQMKSLVNLQPIRELTPLKSAGAFLDEGEAVKELYVRKKQKPTKAQQKEDAEEKQPWLKLRSNRLTSNAAKNKRVSNLTASGNGTKEGVKRANAKTNSISKASTVAITKAKSRKNIGRAKSKTDNIVALAATRGRDKLKNAASMPAFISNKAESIDKVTKSTRKRKIEQDDVERLCYPKPIRVDEQESLLEKTGSVKSVSVGARKSSRLSTKNTSSTANIPSQQTIIKSTQKVRKNPALVVCFSPPLTRSRLKYLTEQGKIVTSPAADVKKRRI